MMMINTCDHPPHKRVQVEHEIICSLCGVVIEEVQEQGSIFFVNKKEKRVQIDKSITLSYFMNKNVGTMPSYFNDRSNMYYVNKTVKELTTFLGGKRTLYYALKDNLVAVIADTVSWVIQREKKMGNKLDFWSIYLTTLALYFPLKRIEEYYFSET